jgi:hypothetical protein
VANENHRFALRVDDPLGGRGIPFERERRILDDADVVAVLSQDAIDALPARAVPKPP